MRRYASGTEVNEQSSRQEIERMLTRYGARGFGYMTQRGPDGAERALVLFEAKERRIQFTLAIPPAAAFAKNKRVKNPETARSKESKRRWRALSLVIKAKLESVASGIETFEEAFLAHIMLPDGSMVGDAVRPNIQRAYELHAGTPLLPAWSGGEGD